MYQQQSNQPKGLTNYVLADADRSLHRIGNKMPNKLNAILPQPESKTAARPPGNHVAVRDVHEREPRLDFALPLVVRECQAEDADLGG